MAEIEYAAQQAERKARAAAVRKARDAVRRAEGFRPPPLTETQKAKMRERARKRRVANPEAERQKTAAWYKANRDKALDLRRAARLVDIEASRAKKRASEAKYRDANVARSRKHFLENRERYRETAKRRYDANPDGSRALAKAWYAANQAAAMARQVARNAARREADPNFRLLCNLRSRLRNALAAGGARKAATTLAFLGCTLPELRAHLEAQFTPGMSWGAYGLRGWHVDHIKPCASFDLSDPAQQAACFHYTNLQPLWWSDNLAKRARTDWRPESTLPP